MPNDSKPDDLISAEPTKGFFVEMITRDIPLEQAVLDLVDNSVDAARRFAGPDNRLDGYRVALSISSSSFGIMDNCGGFDKKTAREYAFRFGRPLDHQPSPHSIGQFGVGMKRALFKFGRHFTVNSATSSEKWAVDVDVQEWQVYPNWTFPWADFPEESSLSEQAPGTAISVDRLRPEVASRFGTKAFENAMIGLIKSKHRQFISNGLAITLNGHHISASSLNMLATDLVKPGVDLLIFAEDGEVPVNAKIVVGIGESVPREAGWYVVCNGRVILEADRRSVTGWGIVEEESESVLIPTFHNQFARFRGIVWFDSASSSRVPWNTTKTDVEPENPIWQQTFLRMVDMMRPVITFLNLLDKDIEENTREKSGLYAHVSGATRINTESVSQSAAFKAPRAEDVSPPGPRMVKIQYSRFVDDVEFLQDALSVHSAKAVGERTFDLALRKQKAE